jgi:flagellar FliJ protein
MKKFEFSLGKILSLREFTEKEARIALGRAVSEAERIRNELAKVARNRFEAMQSFSGEVETRVLMTIQNYIVRLDSQRDKLLADLAEAERVVEEKRIVFAEAMKNRKALSNLKDKRFADYRVDVQRAEDVVLDEIGNRAHISSASKHVS